MNFSNAIRILIADDHPLVGSGLAALLEGEPDIKVVGLARSGQEAVELFRQYQPDITLMDLRMPDVDGVAAIVGIRAEFAEARIIVLTMYKGDEDIYRGLRAGAKGYILKGAEPEELLEAIHTVYSGKQYIPQTVAAKLVERMGNSELSDREVQVLQEMAKGKSNLEIATGMGITERTVKFHINNIFSKLRVSDRTQAVIIALERGFASL
ncbi:response regulator transcription factor [Nostoc sp.]|uniref:response regulator transcription factor n=1 Tax=Nostoc sp. TaxID=1180 RepID=UPI002FFC57E7